MKKIFVVGGWTNYASWIEDAKLVDNVKDADIVLFTGGEDVDPSLYGEEKHMTTFSNLNRDLEEQKIFKSLSPNQLCLGICRGSQFLCVMNGGKLVQDCTNHAIGYTHEIINSKGLAYDITSTHHQMQYPFNIDPRYYDIMFWSVPRSECYEGGGIESERLCLKGEPEIVYYHTPNNPKCLAIQGHPEMMRPTSPVIPMLNSIINTLLQF